MGLGPLFCCLDSDTQNVANTNIADSARRIAERVCRSEGVEFVDVEWKGNNNSGILRVFIDTPEGVTHDHCRRVSRQMSTILDIEEVVSADRYQLEVSSPGLDRKLLKVEDFERFSGKKARIRLEKEYAGKRQLTGSLRGVEDGATIVVETGADETVRFPFDDVRSARLVVEF